MRTQGVESLDDMRELPIVTNESIWINNRRGSGVEKTKDHVYIMNRANNLSSLGCSANYERRI